MKDINVEEIKEKSRKKVSKELIELRDNYQLLNDKYLRVMAEMQNIKRRNDEEREKLLKYDGESFITALLPFVDNFGRAIMMDDNNLEDEVSKFLSGFKMMYGNLNTILTNYEIKEIDCLNKEFDPNTMNAMLCEKIDGVEPNIVVEIFQKGYIYKDKVIRPAMVKVSG